MTSTGPKAINHTHFHKQPPLQLLGGSAGRQRLVYVCNVCIACLCVCMFVTLTIQSAIELQTLLEEGDTEEGGVDEVDLGLLRSPTMVVADIEPHPHSYSPSHVTPHHSLDTRPEATMVSRGRDERVVSFRDSTDDHDLDVSELISWLAVSDVSGGWDHWNLFQVL